MSTKTAVRPRQTTMAGAMVMLAAVFVVLTVWDSVSRLRSIETRESIERFLAGAPGDTLDLSVETMIDVLHGVSIVAALCAVAAVALGWQVLQRSTSARLALSVIAVPLFVTGLVAGGFMSSLVAAATAMLWLSPSREWFAGQPIAEQGRSVAKDRLQAWNKPQAGPSVPMPPSLGGSGSQPDDQPVSVVPPVGRSGAATPLARPAPVTTAMVLTMVLGGLVFLLTLVSMVVLVTQPDLVVEELRRQNPDLEDNGVTDSLLLSTSYVSGGLVLVWSALAVVLAALMAGRRVWAARALLACAALCALVCLIATLASPVALVPAIAAVVTVSCLRRPDVRAWFAAR